MTSVRGRTACDSFAASFFNPFKSVFQKANRRMSQPARRGLHLHYIDYFFLTNSGCDCVAAR